MSSQNLITTCLDCNRGKFDTEGDEHLLVIRQEDQLKRLEERFDRSHKLMSAKRQIEKQRMNVEDEVRHYLCSTVGEVVLSRCDLSNLKEMVSNDELELILDSIDLAARKYLLFDENGQITSTTVELFLKRISGVLFYAGKLPFEQTANNINNLAKQTFPDWERQRGKRALNQYIEELKRQGLDDFVIEHNLTNGILPRTRSMDNLQEWCDMLVERARDVRKLD